MIFYKIEPVSQPKFLFACRTQNKLTSMSKNIYDHRTGIIEISIIEDNCFIVSSENGVTELPSGSIGMFVPGFKYVMKPKFESCNTPISSVAVKFDKLDITIYNESDEEKIFDILERSPEKIFIPEVFTPMQNGKVDIESEKYFLSLLKFIISHYTPANATSIYLCISQWYKLISELNETFRQSLESHFSAAKRNAMSSTYYHVLKVKKHITNHLSENLSVKSIAEYMNLSHDYLGVLFLKETGMTISEYVNRQRVSELSEHICSNDEASFAELASKCGFCDYRYAQKLFKKYIGVNMRDYKKFSNGMTLRHTNPWSLENVESDILHDEEETLE